METNVITINNASKCYYAGIGNPLSRLTRLMNKSTMKKDSIWALKNISLDIPSGQAVGFIGANGSGKTTLLRLLAGVTALDEGNICVHGSLAPLIQIGAGFHPELTGRENVYLNGIILGLSKKSIDARFKDIVAFAELEEFIDMPVKKYSSGMYVRLGFAVAIHVDAQILLVDEILSVGDLHFQRKCLDCMTAMRKTGRTIVFVSHNLSAVRGLCDKVVWLDKGKVAQSGPPDQAIAAYARFMAQKSAFIGDTLFVKEKTRWGTGEAHIEEVSMHKSDGGAAESFSVGEPVVFSIRYSSRKKLHAPVFWIGIVNEHQVKVTGSYFSKERQGCYEIEEEGVLQCSYEYLLLRPGLYHVMAGIYDEFGQIAYDRLGNALSFEIRNEYSKNFEACRGYGAEGIIDFPHQWLWKK